MKLPDNSNSSKSIFSFFILLFAFSGFGQEYNGSKKEINHILKNIHAFSLAYMDADYDTMAKAYTVDGKIMPNGSGIIEGHEAIRARWVLPEGTKVLLHKITPMEITITGKSAYDYGIYEGKTQLANGEVSSWKGKYVIVWKKVGKEWKMYLDIWNRIND